jgi:hypothetical protein
MSKLGKMESRGTAGNSSTGGEGSSAQTGGQGGIALKRARGEGHIQH